MFVTVPVISTASIPRFPSRAGSLDEPGKMHFSRIGSSVSGLNSGQSRLPTGHCHQINGITPPFPHRRALEPRCRCSSGIIHATKPPASRRPSASACEQRASDCVGKSPLGFCSRRTRSNSDTVILVKCTYIQDRFCRKPIAYRLSGIELPTSLVDCERLT